MKKLLIMMALSVSMLINAQTTNFFEPVKEIALRVPSVPIVVTDPYFSIWSPYDKLMEGSTEHWTSAKKPLLGALRVDGKVYRFLGKDKINLVPIAPMTNVEHWEAAYTNSTPSNGWQKFQFDDSSWKKGKAAFGSHDMQRVHTEWKGNDTDIYIRREFDINNLDLAEEFYLIYSHDDVFELYLNGEQLVSTDLVWRDNVYLKLTDAAKKKLRNGKNVIAAHCHNTTGGSYVDFGLFREKKDAVKFSDEAIQKSVDVLATSSYYTFTCGPVELDLVFTAPQLIDDLDLLSTPINYISYRVRALDQKGHDVQLYMETTPELSINENNQPTIARTLSKNGISYVEAGTIDQPICDRKGDLICADWGYAYLASINGVGKSIGLGDYYKMKESFVKNGSLNSTITKWTTRKEEDNPAMAYVHNLGTVSKDSKEGFMMIGYDDIYSIEYMYEKRMGYWKHDGKVTIFDAFENLRDNYQSVMERCRALDTMIYDDAERAGGKKYAEICSAAYRQVMSAHKLFTDKEGNLMWFSKENNSNGCVNTVDLTYPSAPLFLIYNPDLQKAMMTSIFEYSASGRWNKPFPAHDLGTYPIANGQVYGGDMPIEEGGNMVILAAAISKIEGNVDYVKKYWDILTTWTNYLVEYGQYRYATVSSADVSWEIATKKDLGIDFSMFDDKFSGTIDYFYEHRDDIYMERKYLPWMAGVESTPKANVGSVKVEGFDGNFKYRQKIGKVDLTIRGNMTYSKNKILEKDEENTVYFYKQEQGYRINQAKGLVALGLFKDYDDIRNSPRQTWGEVMPGDIKYKDINGDGIINSDDRVAIGATTKPNLTYGFGIAAKWKGLDVNVHFQGVGKSTYQIKGTTVFMFSSGDGWGNILTEMANSNRWILGENEDPNAEYPRLTYGANSNNQQESTYWLRNGSYMRLKTLDIGYSLPKTWVNKAHMNTVRFFFVGTNLLTFSKFKLWDPEMGSSDGKKYPLSKTFALGVSVNL